MGSFSTYTLILLVLSLLPPSKPDPDLLQDYCIADTSSGQPLHLNGHPCIDPSLAQTTHFITSALVKPGQTISSLFGSNITTTNPTILPGSNFQGLTMARIDMAGGGLVPPHAHPRASEVALVLHGTTILVGFVDTLDKLYAQQLRPGDAFVFPRGLMHFLYNLDPVTPAVVISGLSSQNPGVQVLPIAAFRSEPNLPEEVLKAAFKITGQDIQRIRKNLGG